MLKLPTVSKCFHCGSPEITQFWEERDGSVVMCSHCGHRVVSDFPGATKCLHCKNVDAIEFYDLTDGIVIVCSQCGHRDYSGQDFPEYPRAVQCSQCGNPEAMENFEYSMASIWVMCNRCGRSEETGPADDDGDYSGWKREVKFGAGFLQYRLAEEASIYLKALHTAQQVADAEKLVRKELGSGKYAVDDTYLTRWNPATRQVETILGLLEKPSAE